MKPEPIVTVIRPKLREEECEKRIEAVKAAMVQFWLAKIRMEKEKERKMLDYIGGVFTLILFLSIIGVGYHKFMQSMYRDIAEEEAEEIADRKFYEACENAEIRVKQQLVIVDEMK